MKFIIAAFEFLSGLIGWFTARLNRQIGREEQKNDDNAETIKRLQAEKDAAASRPSAVDDLRDGKF